MAERSEWKVTVERVYEPEQVKLARKVLEDVLLKAVIQSADKRETPAA